MKPNGEQHLDSILARFPSARRAGAEWMAICPAHPDRNPSLSIRDEEGRILLHCHAGCQTEAVCRAAGVEMHELFASTPGEKNGDKRGRKIVAEYSYVDEKGILLYQVVRYNPKDFRQRKPDGNGGWINKLNGVRRVLYHLPEVLRHNEIIITEGEKDVETARAMNLCATTAGGAGAQWLPEYTEALRGKLVVIVADGDAPGRKKAREIAAALLGKAASVRVCEMPGSKDLSEWVEKGGTREQLLNILSGAPEWKPEVVDGAALLDNIAVYIRRYVALSEPQKIVAALWTVHTYIFSAIDCTPYLAITSAEKQSGKTRLLEVLDTLVPRPWFTGRVTAAVLTRKIDAEQPTLLLDESDAAFGGEKEYAEALRGVLNTGYRRGGKTSCCTGKGQDTSFKDFSTFCPKAIAGIGKLPDTVADRSIPIRLKRAVRGEEGVQKFRRRDIEAEAAELQRQLEGLAAQIIEAVGSARPQMPEELSDRQQDASESLVAIADLVGGRWPAAARSALTSLCLEAQASDDSIGVQLLNDIRQVYESKEVDRLSSTELADALAEIETSPWGEWSHGKPIGPKKVTRLLRPYGIIPQTIRIGEKTPKGYDREDFADAWKRYLSPLSAHPRHQIATSQHANVDAGSGDFPNRNTGSNVAIPKCEKPNKNVPCRDVAISKPPMERKGTVEVIL